jgi:hypothetical protein
MFEFQILVLTCLTLLTISMFIYFYLTVIRSKYELGIIKRELQAELWKEMRPPNCSHYLGFLKTFPRNKPIPDECLGCTKVILCYEAEKQLDTR